MMSQSLNKEANTIDHGGESGAGDAEGGKKNSDAVPIEPQIQRDGANPGPFQGQTSLTWVKLTYCPFHSRLASVKAMNLSTPIGAKFAPQCKHKFA
jgi:hypothetical protein